MKTFTLVLILQGRTLKRWSYVREIQAVDPDDALIKYVNSPDSDYFVAAIVEGPASSVYMTGGSK